MPLFLNEGLALVDCVWGTFSVWGTCSVSCGDGKRARTRTISIPATGGGTPCDGKSTEEKSCNEGECPGGYRIIY